MALTAIPDGAKPGAEAPRTRADRYAYNAESRARAREDAPITIGVATWHRRRKNWAVTRELRELLRRQEKAGGKADRLRAQVDARTSTITGIRDGAGGWSSEPITDKTRIKKIEAEIAGLDEQIDAASDDGDEAAYEIIALLLRDDAGERPPLDHLKEELDVEEAAELAAMLSTGGEPDPTPETTSS